MKFRNGFVSNSSSSSFILLGYALPKEKYSVIDLLQKIFPVEILDKAAQEECDKNWSECTEEDLSGVQYFVRERNNIRIMSNEDDGAPDENTIVIGRLLGTFSNEDCADPKVEKFYDYLFEVRKIGSKLGIEDNIQLISGTFAS